MIPVWLVVRVALRSGWRSWLALAVLTGLIGGLVLAVAAGARRTDAAYPALVAWSRAPDDEVSLGTGSGSSVAAAYANVSATAISRLAQVTSSAPLDTYTVLQPASATLAVPLNGAIPTAMWHRKLLAGRLPAVGRPARHQRRDGGAAALVRRAGGGRLGAGRRDRGHSRHIR